MSTKIRLSRGGTKKRPHYRVVVADTRSPRDGRFIERLGTYNPLLAKDDPKRVVLNTDRIKYWLGMGAKPTDRVSKFLGMANITEMPRQKNNPIKAKPKAKAQERAAKIEEEKSKGEEPSKEDRNKEEINNTQNSKPNDQNPEDINNQNQTSKEENTNNKEDKKTPDNDENKESDVKTSDANDVKD